MHFARLCDNRTFYRAAVIPGVDRLGGDIAVVIAKATFDVDEDGGCRLAFPQCPIRMVEVRRESGHVAPSIHFPSDRFVEKPGTDVLVVGTARANVGGATAVEVHLRVGHAVDKRARVHGRRRWERTARGIAPGAAAPLEPTPLWWELAYGGIDAVDGDCIFEAENPIGMGMAQDRARLEGHAAPVIEPASCDWRAPRPVGFGPVAANWAPRRARWGTRDARWLRDVAPHPPLDFDPLAHSCAPPGQHCDPPLDGDELCEVTGVTPGGRWRFRLPPAQPMFRAIVSGCPRDLPTHLDTLLIDADRMCVELTWRAVQRVPEPAERLERIELRGGIELSLQADYVRRRLLSAAAAPELSAANP